MRPVPFFDAHCDTVMKVLDGEADFLSGAGKSHIDYPAMLDGGVRTQIFAACVTSQEYPGQEAERVDAMIRTIGEMAESTGGGMAIARTSAEIERAFHDGPIAALLGIEGADCLEGRAENLRRYAEAGVRDLIFSWSDNPFSGTTFGDGGPLTCEGERLLGLAEELHVMVDVSHLSDVAFADVCRVATRPFVASHSNCRSICPSPRNLTDAMIRSMADAGGVMGINLATWFLEPTSYLETEWRRRAAERPGASAEEKSRMLAEVKALPRPSLEWVARHVVHAVRVGGEDCVGIGGDLDGIYQTPAGLEGIADYPRIVAILHDAGLSESQIEKVSHRNFRRVFRDVLD